MRASLLKSQGLDAHKKNKSKISSWKLQSPTTEADRLLHSVNVKKNTPSKMSIEIAFLRIMTSSRSLGCCRSKTWRITSRIGACQACLHLMFMFTDVCACEIRRREVNEACRCACPDGIAPSKVSTSDDVCDDHFLISAKSETLLSRPFSASMYMNFA